MIHNIIGVDNIMAFQVLLYLKTNKKASYKISILFYNNTVNSRVILRQLLPQHLEKNMM